MLIRPAQREYRTWILDSRRWDHYRPRPDDIIVATYPKNGTTWMQQIVLLLLFQSPEPRPIPKISPWIDRRFPVPIEAEMANIEAQTHRRSLKSHLPANGLPLYDEVKYIHVGRDGRDAAMSYHNHISGFTPEVLAIMDRIGTEDDTLQRPYPRAPADPAAFFHQWITEGAVAGHEDGSPFLSYFECERSWWEQRGRSNVLLVHYNDLKADLLGEMRRVADFLNIEVSDNIWPELVAAAGFESMRRDGERLMGPVVGMFRGGAEHFFHQGTNDRWKGLLRDEDLETFARKLSTLPPACTSWTTMGRLMAGEPRDTPDEPRRAA